MVSSNVIHPEVIFVPIDFAKRLLSIEMLLADLSSKVTVGVPEEYDRVEAKEAAKMVRLGINRFYLTYKSFLPYTKMGKKVIFSRKEIESYLLSKRKTPLVDK